MIKDEVRARVANQKQPQRQLHQAETNDFVCEAMVSCHFCLGWLETIPCHKFREELKFHFWHNI
jgi:hypothetical protein